MSLRCLTLPCVQFVPISLPAPHVPRDFGKCISVSICPYHVWRTTPNVADMAYVCSAYLRCRSRASASTAAHHIMFWPLLPLRSNFIFARIVKGCVSLLHSGFCQQKLHPKLHIADPKPSAPCGMEKSIGEFLWATYCPVCALCVAFRPDRSVVVEFTAAAASALRCIAHHGQAFLTPSDTSLPYPKHWVREKRTPWKF
jgi:hypothetical protein